MHNYLDNIGGAEMLTLTLAEQLNADLYTTNVDQKKIRSMGFSIIPQSIGKIPINAPQRQQLALFFFSRFKKQYDYYIISGDWAVSVAVHNTPTLWYVHSPIREIWDLYDYTRKELVSPWKRPLFDMWVQYNRMLNKRYVSKVTKLACNSNVTKERIRRYLHRDATIIHPPVSTSKFWYKSSRKYWLSVNRLITHKRVDLQLEAFRNLPKEKLIIVGSYEKSHHFEEYARYIKQTLPKNVTLLHWVTDKKLKKLYAECKGFITTSHNEDFGMSAVEAMASGKPVIAPNEGGYKESVLDGITGKLITDINTEKLVSAIYDIGIRPERFRNACIKQAQKFDTKVFIRKIKQELSR